MTVETDAYESRPFGTGFAEGVAAARAGQSLPCNPAAAVAARLGAGSLLAVFGDKAQVSFYNAAFRDGHARVRLGLI